ncbi:MAG TPA: molybdenum cofactor biosynthesis protein MoeB [Elusimicrobia bacterium]|nr:MAG: hypothetical protein A2016_03685 [Elusimicrobia bacterium GWF2_62_30]HBA62081.1 molybdenum cofactor biosynthesis protein MoeB [Elusimicrobiota bacterium]
MPLSKEELVRYSRQLIIPGLGPEGQEKIKAAKVAVVGAGGLGSLVLGYLAGAGVGEIGIFDFGAVELSNLHRQLIYSTGDLGRNKTELAKNFLLELNPGVKVNVREGLLTAANAAEALAGYDFIADCTDNFAARAAVNKACFGLKKAYVHGAVYQLEGQLAVFSPHDGPCLGCLVPEALRLQEAACSEEGVLGPTAGAVASMQALEILKLILGMETLKGRFAMLDFKLMNFVVADLKKRADCPVCGTGAGDAAAFIDSVSAEFITPEELKARLDSGAQPLILDLRHDWEHELCHIAGDTLLDPEKLSELAAGLDTGKEIILYCKNQGKSTAAFRRLKDLDFTNVRVLKGGMDAWADKIDKGTIRY